MLTTKTAFTAGNKETPTFLASSGCPLCARLAGDSGRARPAKSMNRPGTPAKPSGSRQPLPSITLESLLYDLLRFR